MNAVKHLVIPAAGLGTRMLPLSAVGPKELLPLGKWPILFYTIQEALQAGIKEIVLVVSPEKRPFFEHAFSPKPHLIHSLKASNKTQFVEDVLKLDLGDHLHIVEQTNPAGLGHAVFCAHKVIGQNPFCVALPDEYLVPAKEEGELKTLLSIYQSHQKSCISLMKVPKEAVQSYGIGALGKTLEPDTLFEITAAVEKPQPSNTPSQYAFIGRYIFEETMWGFLSELKPGAEGELQLTDAIHQCATSGHLLGHVFQGKRFDVGQLTGYLSCLEKNLKTSS